MNNTHYCQIHQQPFFMKGKMKNYAHPLKDEKGETIGWCSEPPVEKDKEGHELQPQSEAYPSIEENKLPTYTRPDNTASIELQVAVKTTPELVRLKKEYPQDQLCLAAYRWAVDRLKNWADIPVEKSEPTQETLSSTSEESKSSPSKGKELKMATPEERKALVAKARKVYGMPSGDQELIKLMMTSYNVSATAKLTQSQVERLMVLIDAGATVKE